MSSVIVASLEKRTAMAITLQLIDELLEDCKTSDDLLDADGLRQ